MGRGERTTAEAEMGQSRRPKQGWVTDDKREKLNREWPAGPMALRVCQLPEEAAADDEVCCQVLFGTDARILPAAGRVGRDDPQLSPFPRMTFF